MSSFLIAHPTITHALLTLIKITLFPVVSVMSLTLPALVYLERKIAAYMQDRLGPNRVGPAGILQPIADAMKFFFKEDVVPGHVDKELYILAPTLVLIPVLLCFAPLPWGPGFAVPIGWIEAAAPGKTMSVIPMVAADLDMGLLYVFAVSSLSVYGIAIGGWASNNKYSIFGGVRSAAQMISYEITLGLSVLGIFMIDGTLNLHEIIRAQADGVWHIFDQPLGFFIFMVSYFAETNRLPFDLPEAETELVAGYHLEYSAMKFAMFFMAEYAAMFVASALMVILFFGGYDIPFVNLPAASQAAIAAGNVTKVNLIALVGLISFAVKVSFFLFFFMAIRWTLPRFRYDQLMDLGWKIFLPLGLVNLVLTAFLKLLFL